MRYFWTVFWTFLLIQMLVYVAGSMIGVAYDLQTGIIITIAASILIFIAPLVLPNEPVEDHH
ncbi:DeoR faimly transcriptional regulator [Mesobacillus campisalis]|uniref:DeoR faimly transcriptional regulator n=1 Tax=Mesobacillus campisalis TaxID=1408103 RepID=A0A0M2SWF1_9BACI|nr:MULTISPECIES: YjzD family protein [Bacillaceae]KKK36950.1 DeoR faimly transcriptional regulator [Mesobacillus campisalis]